MNSQRIILLGFALALGAIPSTFAATEAPTLVLRESIEATGDTLQLKELLTSSSEAPLSMEGENLAETSLGLAPALGREIILRRSEIDSILSRMHPQTKWVWAGAASCRVVRPSVTLTEMQVLEQIESALREFSGKQGEVRVLKLVNFSPVLIPRRGAGSVVELISPNANTQFGSAIVDVQYQGHSFLRRNVRFEWEWKRPVWIALETQSPGRIQPEAFHTELRNILSYSDEPVAGDTIPSEVELIRTLSKGEPLLRSNVKTPIAITRGSAITASIHDGALLVSMKAVALESGSIGQTIRVQNPVSRKEILGRITQPSMVEVIP